MPRVDIEVARHAGVCYGVERALDTVADARVTGDLDIDAGHLVPPRVLGAEFVSDGVHASDGLILDPLRALAALHSLRGI